MHCKPDYVRKDAKPSQYTLSVEEPIYSEWEDKNKCIPIKWKDPKTGEFEYKMVPYSSFGRIRKGRVCRYGDTEKEVESLFVEVNLCAKTVRDFES